VWILEALKAAARRTLAEGFVVRFAVMK